MTAPDAILVAFHSLNQAHRVRRKLIADGHYLELVRVPKSAGLPGCGFGVAISRDELGRVRKCASDFGITIAGAFVRECERWVPV